MRTMRAIAAAASMPSTSAARTIGERNAARRAEELDAEGRRDADHHFRRHGRRPRRPHRLEGDVGCGVPRELVLLREHRLAVEHVADGVDLLPPRFGEPVAGAGPEIVVRIVDGADDPCRADHRRGLQIVAGDASFTSEGRFSASSRKPRFASALMTSMTLMPRALIASEMSADIARQIALASRPSRRRSSTLAFIAARRLAELQFLEHGGDRIERAAPQIEGAILQDRRQPAVGLEVALQHEEILQLLAVQKRGVEGIVVFQDRAEAGADQVRAGDQDRAGSWRRRGFRTSVERASLPRGAFEVEPDGDEVLRHQLAHAAGHVAVSGAPSMPPFCVPCTPMPRCRQRQRASR